MPETTTPSIPTGAKLDALVVWAVGYYNAEPGYIGGADLISIIGTRAGFDSQTPIGYHDERNIQRALGRVQAAGLITFDSGKGYRLGALS